MFTFQWSELLLIVLGSLVLFFGLALLMLRRRNEVLQNFLTPEEPNLEQEFFRVRGVKPEETPPEEVDANAEPENNEAEAKTEEADKDKDAVQWGTTNETTNAGSGEKNGA